MNIKERYAEVTRRRQADLESYRMKLLRLVKDGADDAKEELRIIDLFRKRARRDYRGMQ